MNYINVEVLKKYKGEYKMSLLENIKGFFYSDPDVDDVEEPENEVPIRSVNNKPEKIEETIQASTERRNKVVNIQTTAQLQVVLVKPEVFTDAKQIADHLIAKKTVVLNLETASPENKRRIIDFLVGVAYANGGSLKPVANLTYIITPYNVGFIGEDLVGELENNGVIL